jgi:hypothetical protein
MKTMWWAPQREDIWGMGAWLERESLGPVLRRLSLARSTLSELPRTTWTVSRREGEPSLR